MSTAQTIREQAAEIEQRLVALQKLVTLAAEEHEDPKEAAEAAYTLYRLKSLARDAYDEYEKIVASSFRTPVTIENGAVLEHKIGAPRKKWAHGELSELLAKRIVETSFDFETGELNRSFEEIATEILEYAGVSYWRVKKLAQIGISADKYCEKGDPKESISITNPY